MSGDSCLSAQPAGRSGPGPQPAHHLTKTVLVADEQAPDKFGASRLRAVPYGHR
jgi:hypothetical protein